MYIYSNLEHYFIVLFCIDVIYVIKSTKFPKLDLNMSKHRNSKLCVLYISLRIPVATNITRVLLEPLVSLIKHFLKENNIVLYYIATSVGLFLSHASDINK